MRTYPLTVLRSIYREASGSYEFPRHSHSGMQLYCIVDGRVRIEVGANTYILRPSEALLVGADEQRSTRVCTQQAGYFWVVFENHSLRIDELLGPPVSVPPPLRFDMHELARQLRDQSDVNCDVLVDALLVRLLVGLRLHHQERISGYLSPVGDQVTRAVVAKVLDHMRENLHRQLTRSELAKLACLSVPHLVRLFRHNLGKTPQQVLRELRIERAKHLLVTSSLPLTQIPEQVGLSSYSHFMNMFRSVTGTSPASYRLREGWQSMVYESLTE